MIFTFSSNEFLWSIVVVTHVGNSTSKVNLLAMLTPLDRISLNVGWVRDDISWILFTSEVLLDVSIVRFMFVGCTVVSLLDSALELESLFITSSNLLFSIFDSCNRLNGRLELITKAVVAWFTKQYLVDTRAFFDGVSPDIRRVNSHNLHVIIGDQSRYKHQVMRLAIIKTPPTYPFSVDTCYCHQLKEVGTP